MIRLRNMRTSIAVTGLGVLAVGVVVATSLPAAASRGIATGALQLHLATMHSTWHEIPCPAGAASASGLCYAIQGHGLVRGLGRTTESYTYVLQDTAAQQTTIHFAGAITVAGKGELDVSADTASPVCPCNSDGASFNFTITGGTGAYDGAEGSGTVFDALRATGANQGWGIDTWSGTLTVPGYAFDTTPPVISGAVPKVVKVPKGVKRVRVTYTVSAQDPGEGALPVTCAPRSASLFKLGRTMVSCAATDANGNTARASFSVLVKHA